MQYDKYYHYSALYMKAVKRANPEVSHQKEFFFLFLSMRLWMFIQRTVVIIHDVCQSHHYGVHLIQCRTSVTYQGS